MDVYKGTFYNNMMDAELHACDEDPAREECIAAVFEKSINDVIGRLDVMKLAATKKFCIKESEWASTTWEQKGGIQR